MANERRKCRLADVKSRDVDLRKYAPIIIATIEKTVAGKNPKVYADYVMIYDDVNLKLDTIDYPEFVKSVNTRKAVKKIKFNV